MPILENHKSSVMAKESEQHLNTHLSELKLRLIIWFCTFISVAALTLTWRNTLLTLIIKPLRAAGVDNLVFLNLTEPLIVHVKLALVMGLIGSAPLLLWQIWCFLKPGLYKHERRALWPYFILMPLFSLVGGLFFFMVVLPLAIPFLIGFSSESLVAMPALKAYINFVTGCMLAFALAFNIPLVLLILGQLNILKADDLRKYRRYMIVFWVVLAALLTPPDPLSQLMLALPLVVLYEAVISIMAFQQRRMVV